MKDFIEQFPPATVNNSREIIRKKMNSFKNHPSESKAESLRNLVDDFCPDFSDNDNDFCARGQKE